MTSRLPPIRVPAIKPVAERSGRVVRRLSDADHALFGRVAAAERPVFDAILPRLSRAADHGLLWWGVAGALGATGVRGRRAALRGIIAVTGASIVANGPGKLLFRRSRPVLDPVPHARRLPQNLRSFSFPSGHSATAAAFAVAVAMDAPAAAPPVALLAGGVAFSRVYVGVHYPADVLAGVALGAGAALLTTKVMPRRPYVPAKARPASAWAPALPDGDGLVLVVNARAGNARHEELATRLGAGLPRAEIVMVRQGDDLGKALAAAAARARVLGVAGGDGTINAAATVALEAGLPLAIVPAGTLNHFAGDLGLDSVDQTVEAVRAGTAVAVDVGRIDAVDSVNGQATSALFLNTASLVGYPEMVATRERFEARLGKWPAMMLALVHVLRTEPAVRLEIDGRVRTLWLVFIGNGRYLPDGFAPTFRERLDSGLLDVRLVDGSSPLSRTRLVLGVLTGQLGRSRVYQEATAERVRITSLDGPLPFARDGEVGTEVTSVVLTKNGARLVVYRPE